MNNISRHNKQNKQDADCILYDQKNCVQRTAKPIVPIFKNQATEGHDCFNQEVRIQNRQRASFAKYNLYTPRMMIYAKLFGKHYCIAFYIKERKQVLFSF